MNYLGAKSASGAYQAIIALMPPHNTYIETHLGTGAVMLNKPASAYSIGIDLDSKMLGYVRKQLKAQQHQAKPELLCTDAHDYLKSYSFTGGELLYCDPPYLSATRSSNKKYKYEYTDKDHRALLRILKKIPCSVILSGYPSSIYDEALSDWNTHTFQVMTRGGVRTEKVWFNYELDSVYWASFAGNNFTDRQRIKRKAARWADNYQTLPAGEQLAIMAAMLKTHCDN